MMLLIQPCYFLTFVLFQVCLQSVDAQNSHYGTEFVLGIIPSYSISKKIILDIASEKEGRLYYNIPYLNINRNETLQPGNTIINIDSSLTNYGNFTEQRGIFISTDVPVAVIVTSYEEGNIDSYLALPTSALGIHYHVASYRPVGGASSMSTVIQVIALHNSTNVTVRGSNIKTTSQTLNKLFVYQISSSKDLTSTEIITSKPVAVISGTICAYVPRDVSYCDMLLEQMIPVKSWQAGTYIVPPLYQSKGFLLKILTNSNNDTFCLRNSTRTFCNTSRHLPEEEFLMGTDPVVVTSSEHISVVQYGLGQYDNVDDGPFMTLQPSIDNYLNEYYFVVPPVYTSLNSYISVIIPVSNVNGLLLDGSTPTVKHQYAVPGINFTVLLFGIGTGYHTLKHRNVGVKFGALVYGRKNYIGYGFPLGFQFSIEKPTSSPSTTSESTMTPSTTSDLGRGRTCFACDDMSHVELCDTIKHCSDAEICYMESYIKSGRKTFRSGCLSSAVCHQESEMSKAMTDRCVECCTNDYCNNKGCGEPGLLPLDQRGPLCFDCHHVWSLDECNTLSLCEKGQVCSIEEYNWGDHSHFKMGCSNGLCNPISRSVHMSVRSLPSCHTCCKEDYCNTNCTRGSAGNEGSILVG